MINNKLAVTRCVQLGLWDKYCESHGVDNLAINNGDIKYTDNLTLNSGFIEEYSKILRDE